MVLRTGYHAKNLMLSFVKIYIYIYIYILGVRSLANASRARQFNPLNPPGVGQIVNFF